MRFLPYRLLSSLLDRFEAEGHRLILVAPFETSNSWFPRMVRWIKGARFTLPLKEDAISQAKGQIRQGPWIRQTRLAAWLLVKSLKDQGFDGEAVEVMLQDLAPSTIRRYEWYWKQFVLFCAQKGVSDLALAGIETVVSFVEHMRRSRNYAYQTTKL